VNTDFEYSLFLANGINASNDWSSGKPQAIVTFRGLSNLSLAFRELPTGTKSDRRFLGVKVCENEYSSRVDPMMLFCRIAFTLTDGGLFSKLLTSTLSGSTPQDGTIPKGEDTVTVVVGLH
jgi:hypothetical protein